MKTLFTIEELRPELCKATSLELSNSDIYELLYNLGLLTHSIFGHRNWELSQLGRKLGGHYTQGKTTFGTFSDRIISWRRDTLVNLVIEGVKTNPVNAGKRIE